MSHPRSHARHTIPYHAIPSGVEGCRSLSRPRHISIWVCERLPRCGDPAAQLRRTQYNPSHLISPVQSHPVRSPSHPIPSHPIPSHLVRKGAAAYHDRSTHISGCASTFQGVALLRHSSSAHNTSPPISSVLSNPIPAGHHPIPSHPIPSHLVWKGAAFCQDWGAHVSGCASPFPGVALLRHSSGAHTSHPISSRPVQSHPGRSPSHPIPSHPIPCHLVRKGAAAYHGRGTPISGCASTFQGVALLRHSSGAHNTSHPISSVLSNPIPSGHHPIPSHPIPSHLVWKGAAFCQDRGTHVSGCASPFPGVALLRHSSGAHTSHPISSRPVQSHPGRSPSHPIPSHPIPSHLVRKGAAAYHGRSTPISGCASTFQGVALLRHSSSAHNTSHPISSVLSNPIPSGHHPIPSHPIPSHLVWKGAAFCQDWGTHVSGCASPFPGVALLRHSSGAHTSHPISSRPVQSHPGRSPSHPIPSHPIPCHLVRKGAAAYHGRSTPISGCASSFQGVALLRHSSGAHNTSPPISSVLSNPIPSGHHPIPSHPIPSHLVWKGAAFCQDWGTHVSGCASPFPGVALLRHSSGAHTSHPISSRPVQSHPGRSPSHPIPSHPIPSHLVRKGAAAYHGRSTPISGCASTFQGVALLRHSSGAHNTSHPISSVLSNPIPSGHHPIPSHPIPSHLVWKGAAFCQDRGTHVSGCASPFPGE